MTISLSSVAIGVFLGILLVRAAYGLSRNPKERSDELDALAVIAEVIRNLNVDTVSRLDQVVQTLDRHAQSTIERSDLIAIEYKKHVAAATELNNNKQRILSDLFEVITRAFNELMASVAKMQDVQSQIAKDHPEPVLRIERLLRDHLEKPRIPVTNTIVLDEGTQKTLSMIAQATDTTARRINLIGEIIGVDKDRIISRMEEDPNDEDMTELVAGLMNEQGLSYQQAAAEVKARLAHRSARR